MPKHERYQDYVIRDGRFVGEFEEMYRDHADPWHQSQQDLESDWAVALSLLQRLRRQFGVTRVVELGCGLGHFANRIAEMGFDVTGIDISESAVAKATEAFPNVRFIAADISDHDVLRSIEPQVVILPQITWYILDKLDEFLGFLKSEFPDAFLIHLLVFYPPGVQKYGLEYFSTPQGMLEYFAMNYLENGEVHSPAGVTKTWFLGAWQPAQVSKWLAPEAGAESPDTVE